MMLDELQRRNYAQNTVRSYVGTVEQRAAALRFFFVKTLRRQYPYPPLQRGHLRPRAESRCDAEFHDRSVVCLQRSHERRDAPTHPNPGPRPRCEEPRIERDVGSSYSEERGKEISSMPKLFYGLNQSLNGYVDHMRLGPPVPVAFRHFIELV